MKYWVYKVLKYSLKPFYRLIFLPKYIGCENIPKTGGFIFAGNHTSGLDAATIVSTPRRVIHTLSKKELFSSKFKNWFFRNMACIPVDRKSHDENAKKEVIDTLKEGHAVGIFPEGTINKNRDKEILLPLKKGAVTFAYKSNCPIVPFAIIGNYRIFRRGLIIKYGKPYKVLSDDLENETNILREKIIDLIKGDN